MQVRCLEWNLAILFTGMYTVVCLIAANIGYTFGWIAEVTLRLVLKYRAPRFGPVAFKVGVIASTVPTLIYLVFHISWWLSVGPRH